MDQLKLRDWQIGCRTSFYIGLTNRAYLEVAIAQPSRTVKLVALNFVQKFKKLERVSEAKVQGV